MHTDTKINENNALTAKKRRFNPYTSKFEICKIYRQKVHIKGYPLSQNGPQILPPVRDPVTNLAPNVMYVLRRNNYFLYN